jgi:hypothetical protein
MNGTWKPALVGGLALSLGIFGCVSMPLAQHAGMDRLDTLVKNADAQARSSFSITIKDNTPAAKEAAARAAAGGYHVNYLLVNDWDNMEVTLSKVDGSSFTVSGVSKTSNTVNSTAGFNVADAARSATATMTGLSAGGGYQLTVKLQKTVTTSGGTTKVDLASGTYAGGGGTGFALNTGTNNITVPLTYIESTSPNGGGKIEIPLTDAGSQTAISTTVTAQSSFNIARVAGRSDNTTTYAGTASATTALNTYMTAVSGLVGDENGNLYVADTGRHQIVQLVPGTGSTASVVIAGNGTAGNVGDGAAASGAQLSSPRGLAYIPSSQTLFVVDNGNNRIRKIVGGNIFNFAGGGATTPGTVVGNTVNPATAASLNGPQGIAVDAAGNVFITEYNTGKVLKVGTDNILTVVATGLSGPAAITVDRDHDLLWVGTNTAVIRKISGASTTTPTLGYINTASTSSPTVGTVGGSEVRGLAYDQNGTLYASTTEDLNVSAGRYNSRIWRIAVQTAGSSIGSLEVNHTYERIGGNGGDSSTNTYFVNATTTPVANALNQNLTMNGWCGLYIDLRQGTSTTAVSGVLYNALCTYNGTYNNGAYGHVVHLQPNTL